MAQRARPVLKVRRMFEPTRFADEVVAEAYRLIVPVVHRIVRRSPPQPLSRLPQEKRAIQRGGIQP